MNTTLTSRASTPTRSHRMRFAASLAGIALLAAACGGSDDDSTPEPEPAPAAEPAEQADAPANTESAPTAEAATTVSFADSDLGSIIVDQVGMTLYGFTPDDAGEPTCVDACADAWPPYPVEGDAVPAGLDTSIFSVVTHPNGTNQLKAGKWPLYYFAGDIAPGDTNGQGSGDVWFVAAADGSLIKGEAQGAAAPTDGGELDGDDDSDGYDY